MREDDLSEVFRLGRQVFAEKGDELCLPWREGDVAGILADYLDISLIAAAAKVVVGFCIGALFPENGRTSARILWLGVREGPERGAIAAMLVEGFIRNCAPRCNGRIVASVHPDDGPILAALEKNRFTERNRLLIMDAYFADK